jgi:hypothetical protein
MKIDIIQEVIESEKKAENNIDSAKLRYSHEIDNQKKILKEKEVNFIEKLKIKHKKEILNLNNQLDAEFKTKNYELQQKISDYDNISTDQLKATVQRIKKILLN